MSVRGGSDVGVLRVVNFQFLPKKKFTLKNIGIPNGCEQNRNATENRNDGEIERTFR
jgi:hypothetical protein